MVSADDLAGIRGVRAILIDPPAAVVGRGGDAVFVDSRGWIVAVAGGVRTVLARWSGDRPVLFAAAVAWAQGVDAAVIAAAVERGP